MAASSAPWRASSAPTMPASTSPVPPVASPGLPAAVTAARPSGSATSVRAPFNTTITPVCCASAAAVSGRLAWTSRVERPTRRAISPGCGVRMVGTSRRSAESAPGRPSAGASAFRPSASTRIGTGQARTNACTSARVEGSWPRPGPITTESRSPASWSSRSMPASERLPEPVAGSGSVISSGRDAATIGRHGSGVATVTRPAPERSAPAAASTAAPVFPIEPATTSTWPKSPLCAPGRRRANASPTSRSSSRKSDGSEAATAAGGMPMSATTSSPTASQAGGSTCPRFGAAEGDRERRPRARPIRPAAVRRHAGGKVDGDHRDTRLVAPDERRDREGGEAGRCRLEPRAEDGVDDQIGLLELRQERVPRRLVGQLDERPARARQHVQVERRIALHAPPRPEQHRLRPRAQPARHDETVAPVVASPAEHDDAPRRREARLHDRSHGGAGVLHEDGDRAGRSPRSSGGRPAASPRTSGLGSRTRLYRRKPARQRRTTHTRSANPKRYQTNGA